MKNALHATTSIRRRLLAYLSGGLLALWLATALASAAVALHEINEIADSQMSQLARSLMQVPQAAAGSTAAACRTQAAAAGRSVAATPLRVHPG